MTEREIFLFNKWCNVLVRFAKIHPRIELYKRLKERLAK